MDLIEEARTLIHRHCPVGRHPTVLPRVTLIHATEPTAAIPTVYEPVFCIIVQGRKRVILGNRLLEYGPGRFLIASLDLPVTGEICEATAACPYLTVTLRLDRTMLAAMLLDMPQAPDTAARPPGMAVSALPPELLDSVVRLLRLLDTPRDIPVLAPLLEREILYRLLNSEQGAMLRQIATADSRLGQISRAIGWIKQNYAEPFEIRAVADVANMSPSSLHRHFKAVTAMSPLQFQKQIRLQEARRRLLARRSDAAAVGFSVGYESASQFNREYARLFGAPPGRDAARLRLSDTEAGASLVQ